MKHKFVKPLILGGLVVAGIGLVLAGLGIGFSSTSTEEGANVYTEASRNYDIDLGVLEGDAAAIPDLTYVVQFGPHVSPAARADMQKKIDDVRGRLRADTARADDWLTLGVLYHGANDFEAVRVVWEFLLKVMSGPKTAVLYDNLGKLYKFDLKDFPKSESYFRQSIEVNPDSTTPYFELFELYRYLYKTDTSAAVDIITEAAEAFPNNPDPYVLLGSYYREMKNYDEARAAFTKALDRARELQNVQLVDAIGKEISSLPQ